MPHIDLQLLIDWDNDRLFANAESDISDDIISVPNYDYGRAYASQQKGRAIAGRLEVRLRNDSNKYSRFNTGSPIAGLILPNRRVRLRGDRAGGGKQTLWEGNLDDIQPLPRKGGAHRARLTALGPLGQLQAERTYVDQRTTILTGTAVTAVLDANGFPAADRTIDPGQTTMDRWFPGVGEFGASAVRDVEETESGFMREDKDGKLAYEDRHHRLKGAHLTSQATYSDVLGAALAVEKIPERDPLKEVANIITAKVRRWTTTGTIVLWTLHETGANSTPIPAGVTRVLVAHYPSPDAPTQNSGAASWITPLATTDFTANSQADGGGTDLTADITIGALVEGTDQVEIPVTNTAGVTAFLTFFQARGTALQEDNPATVQHTSSASKTKYGARRYALPAKFIPNTTVADDYVHYVASQLDEPFPVIGVEFIANQSDAMIDEVLNRDVSDRVTVDAKDKSGLGIDEDFFVEHIRVSISQGQLVKYAAQLSPATVLGNIIVLDTGPELDTGILGY